MKYILVLAVIIISAVILNIARPRSGDTKNSHPPIATVSPAPSSIPIPYKTISTGQGTFAYGIITASKDDTVRLIPNFREGKNSNEIIKENSCAALVNGSFYTPQNQPLGLFWSDGELIREYIKNRTIDGILGLQKNGKYSLTFDKPDENSYTWLLQTGPVLIHENRQLPLRIQNDEEARRMVSAITTDGNLVFLTVFDPAQLYDGPRLADLPDAITSVSEKENMPFAYAVNLDGGSASAFISEDVKLGEISTIGSAFCIGE